MALVFFSNKVFKFAGNKISLTTAFSLLINEPVPLRVFAEATVEAFEDCRETVPPV